MAQNVDKNMFTYSIAIWTPLKEEKYIHMLEIKSSYMEIDGIQVSKILKLSQNKEDIIEIDDDYMIVDSVPKRITLAPNFKVEHFPSATISKNQRNKLSINKNRNKN